MNLTILSRRGYVTGHAAVSVRITNQALTFRTIRRGVSFNKFAHYQDRLLG